MGRPKGSTKASMAARRAAEAEATPKPKPEVHVTLRQQPAEKVEKWPLAKIIPYVNNPRIHSEEQIILLAKLMLRHGIDQPIVVDEQGIILKGHGRRLAAFRAGFSEYPVVVHRGLSEEDKRGMRIADNQVSLLSGWDQTLLRQEVVDLQMLNYELPMLGFTDKDIGRLTDDGKDDGTNTAFEPIYQVLIECVSEQEQKKTLDQLMQLGIKCRALVA